MATTRTPLRSTRGTTRINQHQRTQDNREAPNGHPHRSPVQLPNGTSQQLGSQCNRADPIRNPLGRNKLSVYKLVFTEINAKNTSRQMVESEISLKGYCVYHNLEKRNRGICIYIREDLNSCESEIKADFKESLWVEIRESVVQKTLIGCVYRSPNSTEENNRDLNNFLSGLSNIKNTDLILMGDFNYPKITWREGCGHTEDTKSEKFLDSINDAYLYQHIQKPTRYRCGQKENILDLIFTTSEDAVDSISYTPPIGKSDHCSLTFSVTKSENAKQSTSRKIRNYSKANYEAMRSDMK